MNASTKQLKRQAVRAGLPLKHFARINASVADPGAVEWCKRKGLKPYDPPGSAPSIKQDLTVWNRRRSKRQTAVTVRRLERETMAAQVAAIKRAQAAERAA